MKITATTRRPAKDLVLDNRAHGVGWVIPEVVGKHAVSNTQHCASEARPEEYTQHPAGLEDPPSLQHSLLALSKTHTQRHARGEA
jgi:hypothetical protein